MAPFDTVPSSASGRPAALTDGFGRAATYLRLSVTDRCDLRCVYCMPERMRFLPRAEVLTLEELERLAGAFITLGVRKVRLTGGEPLVRKGVMDLIARLSDRLGAGLDELALSTNGTRLTETAADLARFGVRRVNVSMDTLDQERFRALTRGGDLARVQAGIGAALAAGLAIKVNVVALARDNAAEIPELIAWAHARGCDLTLIEAMPMGEVEADRADQFLSLAKVRRELESFWTLTDLPLSTGGPARYVRVEETGGRLGFITPLSHGFCEGCNRVRVTCTGVMHTCLGQDDAVDLGAALRLGGEDVVLDAIRAGVRTKPKGHDFRVARGAAPAVARVMATTGG